MSLSDTFIRRPVLSTVCSILILMAGVIALPLLPIENLPNIAPPTIQVTANLPGADALTVESAVTGPLEEQINGAPGMDYISSNSTSQGVSQINVVFQAGTDPDIDQVNVLNRVQTASAQLPEQVNNQGVTVQQTATSYLLVYNLTSTEGQFSREYLNGLYQLNLAYPLSRAEGVGQVTVFGASDPKTGACGSILNLPGDDRLNHHAEVEGGVLSDECGRLLSGFFAARRGKGGRNAD